jgi:hypothetical protein
MTNKQTHHCISRVARRVEAALSYDDAELNSEEGVT